MHKSRQATLAAPWRAATTKQEPEPKKIRRLRSTILPVHCRHLQGWRRNSARKQVVGSTRVTHGHGRANPPRGTFKLYSALNSGAGGNAKSSTLHQPDIYFRRLQDRYGYSKFAFSAGYEELLTKFNWYYRMECMTTSAGFVGKGLIPYARCTSTIDPATDCNPSTRNRQKLQIRWLKETQRQYRPSPTAMALAIGPGADRRVVILMKWESLLTLIASFHHRPKTACVQILTILGYIIHTIVGSPITWAARLRWPQDSGQIHDKKEEEREDDKK